MDKLFKMLEVELVKLDQDILDLLEDFATTQQAKLRELHGNSNENGPTLDIISYTVVINPHNSKKDYEKDHKSSFLVKKDDKIKPLGCTPGKCYD